MSVRLELTVTEVELLIELLEMQQRKRLWVELNESIDTLHAKLKQHLVRRQPRIGPTEMWRSECRTDRK